MIVIGSGTVGLSAALALSQKTALNIAILDIKKPIYHWSSENYSTRVSAISLASKKFLQTLSIWKTLAEKRVSPYCKMQVWDGEGDGSIDFDCEEIGEPALGYIIEDDLLRSVLFDKIQQTNIQIIAPITLKDLFDRENHMECVSDDGKIFSAKLVIAADGARSWVRDYRRILMKTWSYHHTAIIATVKTELPHQQIAYQCFSAAGPLAFLPLQDPCTSSIVWSQISSKAEKLLMMTDEDFKLSLANALHHRLGKILSVSPRFSFPLQMRHVKNYVQPRLALIGDAAHTLHPLAGQGVNLGLADVDKLVNVIVEAIRKKQDFSSIQVLRRYERFRKAENFTMLAMMDVLKNLFATEMAVIKQLRNKGLSFVNQCHILKKFLINSAN